MNTICPPEVHPFTNRWFTFNEPVLTPKARDAWIINQEKNYFGFLPNHQIKHLIVGSFPIWASVHHDPPHVGFEFDFFYCSRVNGFFSFLKVLSGYKFFNETENSTAHQIIQPVTNFFLHYKLGITDIFKKIQRIDERCVSNLDRDLNLLEFNDLCALLNDYPNVTYLYFTSNAVANCCRRHLRKCNNKKLHLNSSVLFGPGPAANIPAAGILNRDDQQYNPNDTIRFHTKQIPFISELKDVDRLKVSKWAVRLKNVPGLVCPEILTHPDFRVIENRL